MYACIYVITYVVLFENSFDTDKTHLVIQIPDLFSIL